MNNHKKSGGNQMSLRKSATRRVGLFASSSLAAAGIAAAASLGAALAPTVALAQATCASTPAPTGNGTNAVVFPGGTTSAGTTYNPSINCTYAGTGATVSTTGNITVSTTAPGGGVNLIGTGAAAVNWISTAGTVVGSTQTNGPVIDATTETGAINISTAAVTGTSATVSHAIRATSTSGGNVSVSTVGNVSATNSSSGVNGIEAVSSGGDVTVTTGSTSATSASTVSGRLRGIYVQASGGGDVTLNLGAKASATGGSAAVAAAEARTDGGALVVNMAGVASSFAGQALLNGGTIGVGLRTVSGADAVVNLGYASVLTGAWGLDAVVNGGVTTINISNFHSDTIEQWDSDADARVDRIRATGNGALVVNVNGTLQGAVALSGLVGGSAFEIAADGIWYTRGENMVFTPGDDSVVTIAGDGTPQFVGGIMSTGRLNTTSLEAAPEPVHLIDFGAGEDTFENGGYLLVSGAGTRVGEAARNPRALYEGETRFENLETFVNTGTIFLGGRDDGSSETPSVDVPELSLGYHFDDVTAHPSQGGPTDGFHDDILSMPGTTFVGDGGTIYFDVDPTVSQANCDRNPATGKLVAADCIMLPGGATQGVHYVYFQEPVEGDRGQYNPEGIVLVDVAGGTSAQGHFVISPDVRGYQDQLGGIVDKGFYAYLIGYDESSQQHKLFSLPSPTAYQLPLLAQGGHSLWRLSTGSWFDRQADIRGRRGGDNGSVWVRVSTETGDRDVLQTFSAAGVDFTYDNTFTQTSYAVTAGADLLAVDSAAASVIAGLMLGYANSEFEYADSPNFARFDAWTLGGYGSVVAGGAYVDLAINANRAVVDDDVPGADLFPAGTILSTKALTLGAQIEAGWRIPVMADGLFVEPLAAFSYVWSNWEDLYLPADDAARPGINAQLGDPTSTRAGIGGRIGLDQDFGPVLGQLSLLGRVWEEFSDETSVTLLAPGEDPTVSNDFTGRFNELALGASVYSRGGGVSGFLNIGGKFADDYEAATATAGIRVAF
ncbi:MAG TPA: hypothetical protein VD906_03495 [Caulobacteraceae bacterium]|nr:hypothetical protein [Caulobacteraceae bacterium]